uniref:Mei2-like C-terminal RNA recognition motif domain-containing protein n=1 Tax=Zooxanthella nutricula TaxID=1333877 RepID=A0A7S2QPT4_9DINO
MSGGFCDGDVGGPGDITTVMFRDVPRKYSVWMLLTDLMRSAQMKDIDFAFVPWDKHLKSNMGFGFVNFVDPNVAKAVFRKMDGESWSLASIKKSIKVGVANVQGLAQNLVRYMSNSSMDCKHVHAPVVFENGAQVSLESVLRRYAAQYPSLAAPAVAPEQASAFGRASAQERCQAGALGKAASRSGGSQAGCDAAMLNEDIWASPLTLSRLEQRALPATSRGKAPVHSWTSPQTSTASSTGSFGSVSFYSGYSDSDRVEGGGRRTAAVSSGSGCSSPGARPMARHSAGMSALLSAPPSAPLTARPTMNLAPPSSAPPALVPSPAYVAPPHAGVGPRHPEAKLAAKAVPHCQAPAGAACAENPLAAAPLRRSMECPHGIDPVAYQASWDKVNLLIKQLQQYV